MDMQEHSFTLTQTVPFKVFSLEHADSVMDIYQIFINVLMDKPRTEWPVALSDMGLFLEFTNADHKIVDETVDLTKYLSTHQSIPVIEICGLHVPKKHSADSSASGHLPEIRIEIKSHKGRLPDHFRAEIKCMISKGVVEI
jgi:hypothetical protein